MKLNYLTKAAVVVALLSTLSGCWIFMPPGGGHGGGGHGQGGGAWRRSALSVSYTTEAGHAHDPPLFLPAINPRQRKARDGEHGLKGMFIRSWVNHRRRRVKGL